jgi:spore maturation protein CgeB
VLDEIHPRKSIVIEDVALGERIVRLKLSRIPATALHGLEQEPPPDQGRHLLERVQRMAKVVEHTHKDDNVELLAANQAIDVVDVALHELDVQAELVAGKARLGQIARVVIDPQHAGCAAALHLERVEPAVAADVEDRLTGEIPGYGVFEELPEIGRKITQRVIWRGVNLGALAQPQIVEPRAELMHASLQSCVHDSKRSGWRETCTGCVALRFCIFGLTLSSSWANGHATPWRGLLKALSAAGHQAIFFERNTDYYAAHRDLVAPDFCDLVLYDDWRSIAGQALTAVDNADVAMVTSYCADGLAACRLVLDAPRAVKVFYDLDTPVTLAALAEHGVAIPGGARYLTSDLVPEFDLYLSFTGGPVLDELRGRWGARRTAPLYGSVDPGLHGPVANPPAEFRCTLGYLGTYAPDRQPSLERLLIEPARGRPAERFCVVGSLYPTDIVWPKNVQVRWHLDPAAHAAFYSANRITLSITRQAMLDWGYTPSGRLFEAASCGTPVLTDRFAGLDEFFAPGQEILVADAPSEVDAALSLSDRELRRIGAAARHRTLTQHTGANRARELVMICEAGAC